MPQPAERGEIIEPGVERSGTPGSVQYLLAAREVGDSLLIICDLGCLRYPTLRELHSSNRSLTWGFASLHPRLYAIAALRGLSQELITDQFIFSLRHAEAYRTRSRLAR